MSTAAIPLADGPGLRRFTRRTRAVRAGLGLAIVVVSALAVVFARASTNRTRPLLPSGSDGIVVLDLSASAGAHEYAVIARYLDDLVSTHGRFGLVLFSDTAYQALPPNAPAQALATLVPYFAPPYPTNPWAAGFSLGTSISKGLDLARALLLSDGVRRRQVWLISDLSDSGRDRAALGRSLRAYVSSGIDLHVLAVQPRAADLAPYRRLFGAQSSAIDVQALPPAAPQRASYAFPIALAVLAALLAAALAANEILSAPLRWGPLLEAVE